MSEKSKLKLVASSDESSDEENVAGSDDLGLSLDKLNLGPKKKLLILCLGGLLVKRVHVREKASVRGQRPDITYGKFLVFKRPFCTEFLKFCFERFDVALWSSAREVGKIIFYPKTWVRPYYGETEPFAKIEKHNIDGVLSTISGGARSKFVFVWSQEECTDSLFYCRDNEEKPLFLKELKDIWENSSYKGKYSPKNTLLIDDEPHTSLLNPPNTSIFPEPYKKHNPKDTVLGANGELRKYLDGVAEADDVPSYVKEHPIGQPSITPSHLHWSFYSRIVRSFDKKKDKAETSEK